MRMGRQTDRQTDWMLFWRYMDTAYDTKRRIRYCYKEEDLGFNKWRRRRTARCCPGSEKINYKNHQKY